MTVIGDLGSNPGQMINSPGLGEVGEQEGEDVPGELDIGRGHAQVLAPHVGEDVLELVAVNDAHVNLVKEVQA